MFFAVISFVIVCCRVNTNEYNIGPKAATYLTEVLKLLQNKSLRRHTIDWTMFNDSVYRFAKNSQTISDTYPAVSYAIKKLGDNHSYFAPIIADSEPGNGKSLPDVIDEVAPTDIGYIRIPFCVGDEEQTQTFINDIHKKIEIQNRKQPRGWMIDLRNNFGGNMWPMLVAVGCFLDSGVQGHFLDADNKVAKWVFAKGSAYADNVLMAEGKSQAVVTGKSKIAVLVNNRTASSGEAVAVLFKGYSTTRFFGEHTYGVSTGCESFTLSDGSRINLATSVFADRNMKKYGGVIEPDVVCKDGETLLKAIDWIRR